MPDMRANYSERRHLVHQLCDVKQHDFRSFSDVQDAFVACVDIHLVGDLHTSYRVVSTARRSATASASALCGFKEVL